MAVRGIHDRLQQAKRVRGRAYRAGHWSGGVLVWKARLVNWRRPGRRRGSAPEPTRSIGPELLSAASDNDPTNIGTAAAVGAQTGYQLSWMALLVAPLLGIVLTIAAHVGAAGRQDLQSLTLKRYGPGMAAVLLVSVVLVNLVTIAADLQAGAAGIGLLAGIDSRWVVAPLGAALAALLLAGRYGQVVAVLRYLMCGFAAFGAAAVAAHPDWSRLLRATLVPALSLRPEVMTAGLALLGTTLTSYVFVWETIERGVEEPPHGPSEGSRRPRARIGAVIGAVFTAVILWFMVIAAAATLGRHHQTAASAQDAAQTLQPLAGPVAADLFAAGLITSAVIALPVLVTTTAHVVGAHFNWRRGLSQRVGHARGFYAILVASITLALAATLARIPVVGMLVAASVMGGFGTPISVVLLVRLARDPEVMGFARISRPLAIAGWAVAFITGGFGLLAIVSASLSTF
jgi:Mn2+/Fe2+ NRAMP family transporter